MVKDAMEPSMPHQNSSLKLGTNSVMYLLCMLSLSLQLQGAGSTQHSGVAFTGKEYLDIVHSNSYHSFKFRIKQILYNIRYHPDFYFCNVCTL